MTLLVGCMMAMDAEHLLPVSLGSLLKSVDTAIVVDGGSTDGTRSLARSMGAEVVDSPWPAHNAQQRQVYLDSALARFGEREDVWLMVLDSDELLLGHQLKELVPDLERAGKDHAMLPRMWVVATEAGLMYLASKPHFPDYQLRLYRLRKGLRYTGRIHEVLHGLGEGVNVSAPSIGHLDLIRTSTTQRSEKVRRYDRLEPGSGLPRFYLPQRYGFVLKPLPIDGSITPFLPAIGGLTRFTLAARDLRGKSLQYRMTWPMVDVWEWGLLKARRLRRRLLPGKGS